MKWTCLLQVATDAVGGAQRSLPPEIRKVARKVPVHYQPWPARELVEEEDLEPDLLGLFSGTPYGAELSGEVLAPPEIFLYLENHWEWADHDLATFREDVRLTYLHELGHYLGWDEDQLKARGLE